MSSAIAVTWTSGASTVEPFEPPLPQSTDALLQRKATLRLDGETLTGTVVVTWGGEEALVAGWLLEKMPPNGLEVAQGFWNGLRQAALRRQLQIAEGRMKLPRLTTGEAMALQKQILDLTEQLRELSAFSSARVLGN